MSSEDEKYKVKWTTRFNQSCDRLKAPIIRRGREQ